MASTTQAHKPYFLVPLSFCTLFTALPFCRPSLADRGVDTLWDGFGKRRWLADQSQQLHSFTPHWGVHTTYLSTFTCNTAPITQALHSTSGRLHTHTHRSSVAVLWGSHFPSRRVHWVMSTCWIDHLWHITLGNIPHRVGAHTLILYEAPSLAWPINLKYLFNAILRHQ